MSDPQPIDLTPAGAAVRIRAELALAQGALEAPRDLDTALDAYVRALGLALQLGPAPSEDAAALSALGPAVVDLVGQVRGASALPPTPVMAAWAELAVEVGALIGQLGLALALPADRRAGMMNQARERAALLDDTTGGFFSLGVWLTRLWPGD
jgi:hypothetical protein